MSASTTRPVQYSAPLLLSIFARPHQDGLMRSWRADSLCLRRARSRNYPMLQKSPRRSCRIKIRNNRIGANGFLNQRCALTPDLESILRALTGKMVLQHNPSQSGHARAHLSTSVRFGARTRETERESEHEETPPSGATRWRG